MSQLPMLVSGARPVIGHLAEFYRCPEGLLRRGYEEHGDVFRIALPRQRAVVVLGTERSQFFFSQTDRALSIGPAYPFMERLFSADSFIVAEPDECERQRQIILPRFQGRQLDGYIAAMNDEAVQFAESLGESGEFNVTARFGPLTARISTRCFIGADLASAIDQSFFAEIRRFSAGMVPYPRGSWPLPKLIRSVRARDRLRAMLAARIARRRAAPLDLPDFLQTIAEARYPDGTPVPDLVLINIVLLLIVVGHETTNGHLSWALADLLCNPEELARARSESAQVLAGGLAGVSRVKLLRHLDHCVLESERLHPVAALLVREASVPLDFNGRIVPKGALLFASPAVSHRLPDEWSRPDEYWPDRFAQNDGKLSRQKLIGFGGAPHRCLGMHFAYMEMKIILAHLLTRFDMELVGGPPLPVRGFRAKWPAASCRVRYKRRA